MDREVDRLRGFSLPIDLQAVFTFKIWLHRQPVIKQPAFWICLERLEQDVVITRYFHGIGGAQVFVHAGSVMLAACWR